jgi:C1A family cysteine protease
MNIIESPLDHRDWLAGEIFNMKTQYPTTFSMMNNLLPVRDQKNIGSCAAHSASCMKEWQESKDILLNEYLSPQFIYNLRKDKSTSGMYGRDVMNILHTYGICMERDYKYGSEEKISNELFAKAIRFKIKQYARVETIKELKIALMINGPCILMVPTYNGGPIMWLPLYKGQKRTGGHAMTIIGWDIQGFIIRNSWGIKWGTKGYGIFPYGHWGKQWEVWTTVDDSSYQGDLPKGDKKKCCVVL